jgi:hypothetical protein
MILNIIRHALLASLWLQACSPAKKGMENKGKSDSIAAVEQSIRVSFFSRGEGINGTAREQFEKEFPEQAKKVGVGFEIQKSHWGREGETDFCIRLSVKNTRDGNNKIKAWCRTFAETNDRIYVGENEPCKGQ